MHSIHLFLLLQSFLLYKWPPDLITEKTEYKMNESIRFSSMVENDFKVKTMSCFCSSYEFYYYVYKKDTLTDKLYLAKSYAEVAQRNMCNCGSKPATIKKNVSHTIDPINSSGLFILELRDTKGRKYQSNEFKIK